MSEESFRALVASLPQLPHTQSHHIHGPFGDPPQIEAVWVLDGLRRLVLTWHPESSTPYTLGVYLIGTGRMLAGAHLRSEIEVRHLYILTCLNLLRGLVEEWQQRLNLTPSPEEPRPHA